MKKEYIVIKTAPNAGYEEKYQAIKGHYDNGWEVVEITYSKDGSTLWVMEQTKVVI